MFQSAPQANGVIINSPNGDEMIQESPVNLEPNDARPLRERYDGPYQGQPSEMPIRGEAIPTPSGQPIDTYAPPEARLFNESPQSGIRSAPNGTTLPAVNGTTLPAVNGTGLPAVNGNPGQAPLPSQGRANQPLPNQPLPAQPNQGAVPSTNVTPGAQTQNRLAPSGSLRERFTPFRRNPAPNGLPTNNIPQSGSTPAAMQTTPTTVRPVGLQGPGGPG
jgi:hypothetical protein